MGIHRPTIDGAGIVLRKLAFGIALAALLAATGFAQSDCSGCNQTGSIFDHDTDCHIVKGWSWFDRDCYDDCGVCARCSHYISVFGGVVDLDNFESTIANGPNTDIVGAKHDDDWAFGTSFGRQVHPFARGEFEFTFRDNGISSWFEQEFDDTDTLISSNVEAATGSNRNYTGMLNFVFDLYDRQVGKPGLYLGGGIGAIYVDAAWATAANSYESNDTSFAYQFISGLNLPLTDRVDIYTEFRYLGADYLNVDNLTTGQSLGDFTLDSNNLFFGARFRR